MALLNDHQIGDLAFMSGMIAPFAYRHVGDGIISHGHTAE